MQYSTELRIGLALTALAITSSIWLDVKYSGQSVATKQQGNGHKNPVRKINALDKNCDQSHIAFVIG